MDVYEIKVVGYLCWIMVFCGAIAWAQIARTIIEMARRRDEAERSRIVEMLRKRDEERRDYAKNENNEKSQER